MKSLHLIFVGLFVCGVIGCSKPSSAPAPEDQPARLLKSLGLPVNADSNLVRQYFAKLSGDTSRDPHTIDKGDKNLSEQEKHVLSWLIRAFPNWLRDGEQHYRFRKSKGTELLARPMKGAPAVQPDKDYIVLIFGVCPVSYAVVDMETLKQVASWWEGA